MVVLIKDLNYYNNLLHVKIFFLWVNYPPLEFTTAIHLGREGFLERQPEPNFTLLRRGDNAVLSPKQPSMLIEKDSL